MTAVADANANLTLGSEIYGPSATIHNISGLSQPGVPLSLGNVRAMRFHVSAAQVNAGLTLLAALPAAVPSVAFRVVECLAIAIGGAAGAVTTVDLLGTQGGVSVKLCAFAQASLSQSTVLVMGGAGAAVLTDGASYAICDAGTAITLGKTGSALTTATFIDILLTFVLDAA